MMVYDAFEYSVYWHLLKHENDEICDEYKKHIISITSLERFLVYDNNNDE